MLSVACIALVVVLLFLLRQRSMRTAQKHVTDAWRDASELAFDRDLRFYIAREARSGEKPDVYPDYQDAKQCWSRTWRFSSWCCRRSVSDVHLLCLRWRILWRSIVISRTRPCLRFGLTKSLDATGSLRPSRWFRWWSSQVFAGFQGLCSWLTWRPRRQPC